MSVLPQNVRSLVDAPQPGIDGARRVDLALTLKAGSSSIPELLSTFGEVGPLHMTAVGGATVADRPARLINAHWNQDGSVTFWFEWASN